MQDKTQAETAEQIAVAKQIIGTAQDRVDAATATILSARADRLEAETRRDQAMAEVRELERIAAGVPAPTPISAGTRAALTSAPVHAHEVALSAYALAEQPTIEVLASLPELVRPLIESVRETLLTLRYSASDDVRLLAADVLVDLARAGHLDALADDQGLVDGMPERLLVTLVDGVVYGLSGIGFDDGYEPTARD